MLLTQTIAEETSLDSLCMCFSISTCALLSTFSAWAKKVVVYSVVRVIIDG